MRDAGDIAAAFPRPGRALKAVLIAIAAFAIAGAVVVNWAPGGARGVEIWSWLAFKPQDHGAVLERPWALLTSGLLTSPDGISHALWSMLGLYFLTTDLERRWGGARLLRFLALSVVIGNLVVLAGTYVLPRTLPIFHPALVIGPFAAVLATTIAWAKENADREIRFMFFLPMSGRLLYWITIGGAVLAIVFAQGTPEGVLALPGGVLAGVLFSGAPSPARALWLRIRLGTLRRKGTVTVDDLLRGETSSRPRASRRSGKAPPLRIVQGGLDEDLKNRKPPKDKRYLN